MSKSKQQDTGWSWYSLIGWALFVITLSITIFIPWLYNEFLILTASWVWIFPALALVMVAFGVIRNLSFTPPQVKRGKKLTMTQYLYDTPYPYHFISIVGWGALALTLILSMYTPLLWSSTFAGIQRLFGL
jgi:hypothetical protein